VRRNGHKRRRQDEAIPTGAEYLSLAGVGVYLGGAPRRAASIVGWRFR
jgi:hypothetical protein